MDKDILTSLVTIFGFIILILINNNSLKKQIRLEILDWILLDTCRGE